MVTTGDIKDIQALKPDEQVLVLSLVRSFINSRDRINEDQERLARMRQKYVANNPMTMDEINILFVKSKLTSSKNIVIFQNNILGNNYIIYTCKDTIQKNIACPSRIQ